MSGKDKAISHELEEGQEGSLDHSQKPSVQRYTYPTASLALGEGPSDERRYTLTRHTEKESSGGRERASEVLAETDFRMHHSREFKLERILKIIWFEPGRDIGDGSYSDGGATPLQSIGLQGTRKIRRFVIVETSKGHSTGIPISTYGFRGCAKPGCYPNDHAIIYTDPQPPKLPNEPYLSNPPIKVRSFLHETLDPTSRVNYAKKYTIEHSFRVSFIGRIHSASVAEFWSSFNSVRRRYGADLPLGTGTDVFSVMTVGRLEANVGELSTFAESSTTVIDSEQGADDSPHDIVLQPLVKYSSTEVLSDALPKTLQPRERYLENSPQVQQEQEIDTATTASFKHGSSEPKVAGAGGFFQPPYFDARYIGAWLPDIFSREVQQLNHVIFSRTSPSQDPTPGGMTSIEKQPAPPANSRTAVLAQPPSTPLHELQGALTVMASTHDTAEPEMAPFDESSTWHQASLDIPQSTPADMGPRVLLSSPPQVTIASTAESACMPPTLEYIAFKNRRKGLGLVLFLCFLPRLGVISVWLRAIAVAWLLVETYPDWRASLRHTRSLCEGLFDRLCSTIPSVRLRTEPVGTLLILLLHICVPLSFATTIALEWVPDSTSIWMMSVIVSVIATCLSIAQIFEQSPANGPPLESLELLSTSESEVLSDDPLRNNPGSYGIIYSYEDPEAATTRWSAFTATIIRLSKKLSFTTNKSRRTESGSDDPDGDPVGNPSPPSPDGFSTYVWACLHLFAILALLATAFAAIGCTKLASDPTRSTASLWDFDHFDLLFNTSVSWIGAFFCFAVTFEHIRIYNNASEWYSVCAWNFLCVCMGPAAVVMYTRSKLASKALSSAGGLLAAYVSFLTILNGENIRAREWTKAQQKREQRREREEARLRDEMVDLRRQLEESRKEIEMLRQELVAPWELRGIGAGLRRRDRGRIGEVGGSFVNVDFASPE